MSWLKHKWAVSTLPTVIRPTTAKRLDTPIISTVKKASLINFRLSYLAI